MKFLIRVYHAHHSDHAYHYAAIEVTEFLLDMIQLSQHHGQELDLMVNNHCQMLSPEFYMLLPVAYEKAGLMEGDLDHAFRLPDDFEIPPGDTGWNSRIVLRVRHDYVCWVISSEHAQCYQETQRIVNSDLCTKENQHGLQS